MNTTSMISMNHIVDDMLPGHKHILMEKPLVHASSSARNKCTNLDESFSLNELASVAENHVRHSRTHWCPISKIPSATIYDRDERENEKVWLCVPRNNNRQRAPENQIVRISASRRIGCIVRYIWCIWQLWATKGTVRFTGTENSVETKAHNAERNQDIQCGGSTEKPGWREAREHQTSDHWYVHGDIGLSSICTEMTRTSSNTGQCQRLKQW
jgi:hypothetical protein